LSVNYINSLEFFDQEYSNLNKLIENINFLFVQTKNDYDKLNFFLNNLISSITTQSLNYDSFNNSIVLIKDFMKSAEDFSISAKCLYDSVIHVAQNSDNKIEGIRVAQNSDKKIEGI